MKAKQSSAGEGGTVRSNLRGRSAAACLFTALGLATASVSAQAVEPKPYVRPAPIEPAATSRPAVSTTPPRASTPAPSVGPSAGTPAPSSAPAVMPPSTLTSESVSADSVRAAETTATEPVPAPISPDEVAHIAPSEKREIADRLRLVDGRLDAVDQKRSDGSIAGPISMLAAGYTMGLATLGVSLASFAMAEQVQKRDEDDKGGKGLDVNNDGSVDGDDEATFRRVARGLGIASAVGFGVGIVGNVLLAKRLKERRKYDPEVRELQRNRRDLRRQLEYGANASPAGMGLSLSGRF